MMTSGPGVIAISSDATKTHTRRFERKRHDLRRRCSTGKARSFNQRKKRTAEPVSNTRHGRTSPFRLFPSVHKKIVRQTAGGAFPAHLHRAKHSTCGLTNRPPVISGGRGIIPPIWARRCFHQKVTFEHVRRHGLPEQRTLYEIKPPSAARGRIPRARRRLQTDLDVHVMTERHHKMDERGAELAGGMCRGQNSCRLDHIRGGILEHTERRIARAEIIHRNTDAEVSDALEHSPDTDIFTDRTAFRKFNRRIARGVSPVQVSLINGTMLLKTTCAKD